MTATPARALATAAVALVLAGGLAGCGGRLRHTDGGATAPVATVPAASAPAASAPAAPGSSPAAGAAGDASAAASVNAALQQADQVLASGEAAVAQDG